MLNQVQSWLYVGDELRPFVVLDGLPGLYGLKYDSVTACGYHCTCALINGMVLLQGPLPLITRTHKSITKQEQEHLHSMGLGPS